MPNQPRADNKAHAIRCEDELWAAAEALAAEKGISVSMVVRVALRRYVDRSSHSPAEPETCP